MANIMDFIVITIGATIVIAAALIIYISGMKQGSVKVRMEYKDCISLKGLSAPSKEVMHQTLQRRHIWEETRGPNKHLYKPVHYD